ncbi:cell division protein ZapB [Nitrospiraceae bacterium AH_259_D15_M11_P09]|nr:cell division protein ZapB [Nitrospiraceae bacterium AH_259_D15_M11_P09]
MALDKMESLEARIRGLVELVQSLKRENAELKGTVQAARERLLTQEQAGHRWVEERVQIRRRIEKVMGELDSLEYMGRSKEVAFDKDHRG